MMSSVSSTAGVGANKPWGLFSVTNLPRNSNTMRSAVFLPIPGADAKRFTSSSAMACANSSVVIALKMPKAVFAPMPLTLINWRNVARSALLANPNNK